ncbi:M20 metallopeptidase family protein [Blastococcus tunisiensis]|uniref:Hippurate hydrolase n=1 Tax=Blastococcus tunisiensis TaxID=1798228 RepID=A0A1I2G5K2_9ACTN|nr:M20 family metallopeptidase [Blastococcus sp. DSM 46838]SFF12403.1 hippurate hydrolase [Blastococcus sp. DSM 46838]
MPTSAQELLSAAYDDADRTIDLRRRLHRCPEIGLHLPRTQELVLEAFADLPVQLTTGTSTSSVVAVLHGSRPGPTYLLRGDMDALPVHEDTGLPFASEHPGAMHACGHDTHVAMLLGAARLLAARRDELAGQVVFMVQPGEEGFHGARYMLEEGLLDVVPEAPVSGAFALHVGSTLPSGSVHVRPGPMMAAADQWAMTVQGRGGHASDPAAAADPIPVAAEIVLALQSMVTRRVDVFDPAVVTVAHLAAGSTNNVIPDTAFLEGTIRTLSAERRADVVAAVRRVATHIGAAHGLEVAFEHEQGYPVTVNDPAAAAAVLAETRELLGERASVLSSAPLMGAEDFSYVLEAVPGAMAWLGACPPGLDPATAPANHSNLVVFDEEPLPAGAALYARMAMRALAASG